MKKCRWMLICVVATIQAQASQMAELGNQQYLAEQWQAAAESYETLVNRQPDNWMYWQRLSLSYVNLKQYAAALEALQKLEPLLPDDLQRTRFHLAKARALAALNQFEAMLAELDRIAEVGGTPYLRVINTPEFLPYIKTAEFLSTAAKLRPCQSLDHRAFDFWLGDWTVTSPSRQGWQARSSITLGNEGCSIQEAYSTRDGYAGTSTNFFDTSKKQWHQTWIDNQGNPLYLEGGVQNGAMVMSDGRNRITWTRQLDGRVRQHWEVTNEDGETFSTAFDGYYQRVARPVH